MHMIAVLALSLSGLVGQAPSTNIDATATAAVTPAENCDDVQAGMSKPNMTAAEQNKMLDAVSACYADQDKKREVDEAAKPKAKGVNLWD